MKDLTRRSLLGGLAVGAAVEIDLVAGIPENP